MSIGCNSDDKAIVKVMSFRSDTVWGCYISDPHKMIMKCQTGHRLYRFGHRRILQICV